MMEGWTFLDKAVAVAGVLGFLVHTIGGTVDFRKNYESFNQAALSGTRWAPSASQTWYGFLVFIGWIAIALAIAYFLITIEIGKTFDDVRGKNILFGTIIFIIAIYYSYRYLIEFGRKRKEDEQTKDISDV